ncbi:CRISPR-associated helicase Cas3' [Micromonospora sp. WMMD1102]|uniref:CRISPR-associated helicase Cas3' n=1 Tax=Micromonospora sp. WMMD1102 TaxID=3016105 RepID=UPI0024152897|nr:CRISPR-associated helicase Cas3' [Micromonospora sp. WMMD1102]MDG4788680.1 CRISPR-associated helicase Cas3' [Micromonospora sp. WMMD1102]
MVGLVVANEGQWWAHSPAPGTGVWHSLEDHLRGTADLARRFATPFGGGDLAYWLGLLHDCGKASDAWQSRLAKVAGTRDRVGIDHKALGTRVAYARGLGAFALGIFGHHGGLLDPATFKHKLTATLRETPGNLASAEAALPKLLPDLPAELGAAIPDLWRQDTLVGEMALRLCFSALVDADVLDTQAHHHQLPAPRIRPDADFAELFARFEEGRAKLLAQRSPAPIDGLREQVYADCLAAAEHRPGIFRLPAPTGVGKTFASAGFALRHAALHGQRRVVVAVPFLTITEQNAAVYRTILNGAEAEPVVLEHHSQVNFDDPATGGPWGRQAAENWDAPFVVTTFVRLFESLYARKPSAMRRVHRLANSVIVLDEVQALPHDMLVPILDGLRLLVEHFGATVLLCSATQPDFWALSTFADLDRFDLVSDIPTLTERLRRVDYEWRLDPAPTLAEVAEEAASSVRSAEAGAAMVVLNTTENARTVYETWRAGGHGELARHLSTRMCPAHRHRVLDIVTRRLKAGEPVLLAATQLVEAGVDLDFPLVFRAMAPADSLLQAGGRANREGRIERGRVVVFAPSDGGHPRSYRPLIGVAEGLFGPDKADPDDPEALIRYYQQVYKALNLADARHIGQRIQQARSEWKFETVTDGPLRDGGGQQRDRDKAFRLIRDEGVSVVTPQGAETSEERAEIADLVERVRTAPVPDLRDLRRLQPYTTTVHPGGLRNAAVTAWMRPILGDQVRVGALVEWFGRYDEATGISFDPDIEEFVL